MGDKFLDLSGKSLDIPDEIVRYLDQNRELLIASAYDGYITKGRGLLWLDWSNSLGLNGQWALSNVAVIYITPSGKVARTLFPDGMSDAMKALIQKYDPEMGFVIN